MNMHVDSVIQVDYNLGCVLNSKKSRGKLMDTHAPVHMLAHLHAWRGLPAHR